MNVHYRCIFYYRKQQPKLYDLLFEHVDSGLRFVEVWSKLSKVEADDREFFLIRKGMKLFGDSFGNATPGNWTANTMNMEPKDLDYWADHWYNEALNVVALEPRKLMLPVDLKALAMDAMLDNFKNSNEQLPRVACERKNCPHGITLGVFKSGYCVQCHASIGHLIRDDKEIPPYNVVMAVHANKCEVNQPERSVAFILREFMPREKFCATDIADHINELSGTQCIGSRSIGSWIKKFDKTDFKFATMQIQKKIPYSGLTHQSLVACVLTYKRVVRKTADDCFNDLCELFDHELDKKIIDFDNIEDIYEKEETFLKELRAAYVDKYKVPEPMETD